MALSLGEDVLAIGLTWMATRHPYIAGTLVLSLVIVILVLVRLVVRALRALFAGAQHEVR